MCVCVEKKVHNTKARECKGKTPFKPEPVFCAERLMRVGESVRNLCVCVFACCRVTIRANNRLWVVLDSHDNARFSRRFEGNRKINGLFDTNFE